MSVPHIAQSPSALLLARFGGLVPLGERERQIIRKLGERAPQAWQNNTVLLAHEGEGSMTRFIVSGWAARVRALRDGRRQIIDVHVPGDWIGHAGHPLLRTTTRTVALSPLRTIQTLDVQREWSDRSREPVLSTALGLIAAEDQQFAQNQVVRLGRQTAYERIAHWLAELHYRLSARGEAAAGSFVFPLTQEAIADVVGLSVVHVNRTLQEMRRQGRIELRSGRLNILALRELIAAGEFIEPTLKSGLVPDDVAVRLSQALALAQ